MRPLLALRARLTAGLLALLPLTAAADPIGYVAGFDRLYRIDLATGQLTSIGPIGFSDVEGLAFSTNGILYGVADAAASSGSALSDVLVRINTSTGAGTLVGPLTGLAGVGPSGNLDYGLAATCDGRLWMSSDTTSQLWEVSPSSGGARFVGNLGQQVSGLAARGDQLYGVTVGQTPSLLRIDLASGATSMVGPLGVGGIVDDAGLDFDVSGALWAVLDPEPTDEGFSRVARVNSTTGQGTVIATANILVGLEGMAISPPGFCGSAVPAEPRTVPGPGAPLLTLLGVLALALGVHRARQA
jgi:hypothetical protein